VEVNTLVETALPEVPEPGSGNTLECLRAIKEILAVREGITGDPLDQVVTYRELYQRGMLDRSFLNNFVRIRLPGENVVTLPPPAGSIAPDFNPPPPPTGLTATGALANVILDWNDAQYHNHAYTEIWRSGTNDLGAAIRIGTRLTGPYADDIGQTGLTRYYWIRHVSIAGVPGPFNATNGTSAVTGFVDTPNIADFAVTNAKIGNLAVDNAKIANATIAFAKFDTATFTTLSAFTADMGTLTAGTITLNSTGHIKSGQTAFDTGTGFFLGISSGVAKFSLGNPAGNYIKWDGSSLTVGGAIIGAANLSVSTLSAITANMGSITAGNITLDTSGYIKGGQTAYNTGAGFFLGHESSLPKFSLGDPDVEYLTWTAAEGIRLSAGSVKIFTPLITANWTERSNPKNVQLNSVTWSGSIFVAVGDADGTDAYIVTSSDGITWTERSNPKNFRLKSAVRSGSIFVAVGEADGTDAYIITSSDGTTWTERSNPKNVQLNSVTWSGSIFVAVGLGDGTDAYIVTSSDGITWTERSNPKNIGLNGITWSGSLFVAVGSNDGTDAYIITSSDGTTWTERSNPKGANLFAIAWNGSIFAALGPFDGTDTYIVTSPDGITWTERNAPNTLAIQGNCVWNGGFFVAVGNADAVDAYILISENGKQWVEKPNPKNVSLLSATWNGSYFTAVGSADGTDAYIITSLKV
jgi:hypothetical protein